MTDPKEQVVFCYEPGTSGTFSFAVWRPGEHHVTVYRSDGHLELIVKLMDATLDTATEAAAQDGQITTGGPMDWEPPLDWCIVDCDGSACGSGPDAGRHTHQVQSSPWYVNTPVARAYIDNGHVTYSAV